MILSTTNIKSWGKSAGIKLSKKILAASGMSENEEVQLSVKNGQIIIEPKKPQTIEDIFKNWHGYYAPSNNSDDWDSMPSVGEEF